MFCLYFPKKTKYQFCQVFIYWYFYSLNVFTSDYSFWYEKNLKIKSIRRYFAIHIYFYAPTPNFHAVEKNKEEKEKEKKSKYYMIK